MAALSCLSIRAVEPECVNGLIDENLIPMVRLRSPQTFQETFQVIRVIGTHRLGVLLLGRGFFFGRQQALSESSPHA
jgi:hypothetical protein